MFTEWGGHAAMAAVVTPLTPDGRIDILRLRAHALDLLSRGLDAIVPFGTTGEGASFSARDKMAVIDALLAGGVPAARIVVGVAESSVTGAVDVVRHALGHDCAGVLLAPPYYFPNVPDAGVFRWHAAVIERLGAQARDIIAYNLPGVIGVTITPELLVALRRAFGGVIAAIKDSAGDRAGSEAFLALGDIPVMVGHEGYLAAMVRQGAVGSISGLANLIPERLAHVCRTGKEDEAFAPAVDLVCAHPVVPAIRAILAQLRADTVWSQPMPPLEALAPSDAATLAACWTSIMAQGS